MFSSRAITLNNIILLIIYYPITCRRGGLYKEQFSQAVNTFLVKSKKFWFHRLMKTYKATETVMFLVFSSTTIQITRSASLPASEFRGQLGEEVGGGPGAGMGQWAGVVVRQSGWSGRGRVDRGTTIPQLSPVKGAADCGASSQAASVWGGRWACSSSCRNAERGGRRCRHAVAQGTGARKKNKQDLVFSLTDL